jgi:hypothetical protein
MSDKNWLDLQKEVKALESIFEQMLHSANGNIPQTSVVHAINEHDGSHSLISDQRVEADALSPVVAPGVSPEQLDLEVI